MIGQTISHYRILEKLGEGGMGVVYKAEDTKLHRTVALKFLPPDAVESRELKARFLTEAEAAAALIHPNICVVHEIDEAGGSSFIAMEYVEGQSLAEKIEKRPLPLDEALGISAQVANGLHAAHKQGIVHRDIKPANIMIDPEGRAKIMDFGLAHLDEATRITQTGAVMGTPAYMSPEQVRGEKVDHRTDIWSLGVVLYEMVVGRLPFRGGSAQMVAVAIQNDEPEPISAQRAGVPLELEWVVAKTMAKEPSDRYQHAEEVIVDLRNLQQAIQTGRTKTPTPVPQPALVDVNRRLKHRQKLLLSAVAALILAVVVTIVAVWNSGPKSEQQPPLRKYLLPADQIPRESRMNAVPNMAISPNGRYVAYVPMTRDAKLCIRDLTVATPREIPGTDGALYPFWSPDSEYVAYYRGGDLYKVAFEGPATKLCGIPDSAFVGGAWNADGTIVFSTAPKLYAVESVGGSPKLLFGDDEFPHPRRPQFLLSGTRSNALLFQTGSEIAVGNLATSDWELLPIAGSSPVYSPSGHILYQSGAMEFADTSIWALPFSPDTLRPTGDPFPVAHHAAFPSVSRDGTLIYLGQVGEERKHQLVWRDRSGKKVGEIGRPQEEISLPSLSPDGEYVAVEGGEKDTGRNIWIHSTSRPIKTQLTSGPHRSSMPIWSPSGNEIAYNSFLERGSQLFIRPTAPDAKPLQVVTGLSGWHTPSSWSPNGRYLMITGGGRLCYLTSENSVWSGNASCGNGSGGALQISPDGEFIAYVSAQSERPDVYVRPFPPGRGTWELLIDRGCQPRWSRNGKELFFVQGDTLMSVPVTREPTFSTGVAKPLFSDPGLVWAYEFPTYDVSLDGQRFVTIETLGNIAKRIHVVQNWFEEFRERE